MEILKLELQGNIPSKKNSRINLKSGVSIPSQNYRAWHDDAMWQLKAQTRARICNPVIVEMVIYFGTKARADLDNRITSILDLLTDALILSDDKWQNIPEIHARAEYRKGNAGASIIIKNIMV